MMHFNPSDKPENALSLSFTLTDHITTAIQKLSDVSANGRSFYLYDPSVMVEKLNVLRQVLPRAVKIYYAQKANPHAAFLRAAREGGAAGIEIASIGEGRDALKAGFHPSEIIFTGPGKSPEELAWSVEAGIGKVHVESLTEAHRLNKLCKDRGVAQDILVRVNPNFQVHGAQAQFSGDSSKLGVDQDFFRDNLGKFLALEHLNFKGLHVYSASGVLRVADVIENCNLVFKLAREIEAQHHGVVCEVIDFGGGFGIDYSGQGNDFDVEEYAKQLKLLTHKFGFQDRTLVLELGRYLAADSGWYCTEILDIKDSLGKLQVICQGGAHHFRRPVALGLNHPTTIVAKNRPKVFAEQASVHKAEVFFGGPLCNSADKLAPRDVYVESAEIGDIAVFGLAGAYGLTMSHHGFLSHAIPKELLVSQA